MQHNKLHGYIGALIGAKICQETQVLFPIDDAL